MMSIEDFIESPEYDLSVSKFGEELLTTYELSELMYQSTISHIFMLRNTKNDKNYTLKAIRKKKNIKLNLNPLKNLKHKNIAKIIEVSETEKYIYVIKEFVEGINLRKYVKENGKLSDDEIKTILLQLLEIFDYFHKQESPIIYRDLKPENIILGLNGKITLIDLVTVREVKSELDHDTFYVGTRGYASPEHYGFSQTDSRSDIYTIGTTLYYLITGSEPKTNETILKKIDERKMISDKYKDLIKKCCAFDPENRYGSTEDIRVFLKSKMTRKKKRIILIAVLMSLIILSSYGYSQRFYINYNLNYPIYNVGEIKEQSDITVDSIPEIPSGVLLSRIEEDVINIRIDKNIIGYPNEKIKYIAVGTSNRFPRDKEILLQDNIYYAIIKGYGLQEYDARGFNSVVRDGSEMLILIFDKNYQCLGYKFIEDLSQIK